MTPPSRTYRRRLLTFAAICAGALLLHGCATQPPSNVFNPPSFLSGLLHGFLIFFTFIGSLFTDYRIYAFSELGRLVRLRLLARRDGVLGRRRSGGPQVTATRRAPLLEWRWLLLSVAVSLWLPARAHHSPAAFDQQRELRLNGVVENVEWVNPHVSFQIAVEGDAGERVTWVIEAQSPRVMGLFGWSPDALLRGDRVTVVAHPARAGDRPVALGRMVEKIDGRRLAISWQPDEIRDALRDERAC